MCGCGCVYLGVCVRARTRSRERDKQTERETERFSERNTSGSIESSAGRQWRWSMICIAFFHLIFFFTFGMAVWGVHEGAEQQETKRYILCLIFVKNFFGKAGWGAGAAGGAAWAGAYSHAGAQWPRIERDSATRPCPRDVPAGLAGLSGGRYRNCWKGPATVCPGVCERERARDRERESVCVCVCVSCHLLPFK